MRIIISKGSKKFFTNLYQIRESFVNALLQPGKSILKKAFFNKLAIPKWEDFTNFLTETFNEVKKNKEGKVATYIPELGNANPEWFGVSVCTIDGQRFSIGDAKREFSLQSCGTKIISFIGNTHLLGTPLLYSLCIEDRGYDFIHKYIGKEPSGTSFNAFTLNYENKPHNACINAGAMIMSL